VGERYQEDLNPSLVGIARKVLGGAQRPASVAAEDPYGIGAWLKGAGPMPTPIAAEIQAYHGSPHDFEKFLLEKIGTGEGAQAYGHGLYFAENPGVASEYQRRLAANNPDRVSPDAESFKPYQDRWNQLKQTVTDAYEAQTKAFRAGDTAKAQELQKVYADAQNEMDAMHANMVDDTIQRNPHLLKGRMYEVSIKADPDQFLDWDKPLSQQPDSVKTKLQPLIDDLLSRPLQPQILDKLKSGTATGHNLYMWLGGERALDDAKVSWPAPMKHPGVASSEALRNEAGIPGIKYLDQGSRVTPVSTFNEEQAVMDAFKAHRAAPTAETQKALEAAQAALDAAKNKPNVTHNYVVFDDKLIDIKRKFAAALAAGGSLASLGQPPAEEQK
jgi:hypothetical protein